MTTSLRKNLLALAIFNAASMLAEQAPPAPTAPVDPMAPGGSAPGPEAQLAAPTAPGAPSVPGAPTEELSVDTLIDRLNSIRAGKSFSDPEVYGKLTTLYNQIPQEERPAIDKLMADIGVAVQPAPNAQQLAQGQPTPETAAPPAAPPPAAPAVPAAPPPAAPAV